MGNIFYFEWEPALIEWLQANLGSFGASLAAFISNFGEELFLVAILGFLYWCWDKRAGATVGLSLLTISVWNPMVKNIALRQRPYMAHSNVKCLKPVDSGADIMDVAAQGYSFPSGHSASTAATYGAAARTLKKRWLTVTVIVLVFLVGVSRFILGVHYPTDVLAGWTLGVIAMLVVALLERKIQKRWLLYAVLIAIAVPGMFYCTTNDYYSSFGMLLGMAAGDLFERKYVNFENTRNPLFMILRLIGGIAVFFGFNTVLKMPFSSAFLSSGTPAAFAVRVLRYAVVIFLCLGVYPMLFKLVEKKKKA
ncbi:MAG: phosphatase PAP2 family protein [Lachnospiraceae bacterium]|nr:phosphatase PAP2 family protein [Lachnospiraceae bacterium]